MPDFLDQGDNSILSRLSTEAQDAINAKVAEWFGHDSELGGYDEDTVKELGRNTI